MESIKNGDKYLDPPAIPEYAECAKCGGKFHADDLDEDWLCDECVQLQEAEERRENGAR